MCISKSNYGESIKTIFQAVAALSTSTESSIVAVKDRAYKRKDAYAMTVTVNKSSL